MSGNDSVMSQKNFAATSQTEELARADFSTDAGALAYANGNQLTPMPLNDIVIHGTSGRIDGRGITRNWQEGEMRVVTAAGERSG